MSDLNEVDAEVIGLYHRCPLTVAALQWSPGNLGSVGFMIGWLHNNGIEFNHFGEGMGDETGLNLLTARGVWEMAHPLDWVLKRGPGDFAVMGRELFEADYVGLQ